MIFIGMSTRTSGMIRGKQIADRMGGKFFDQEDERNISKIRNETVIFIRSFNQNLAWQLKCNGCKIGYDLLDRPVADAHLQLKSSNSSKINWTAYTNRHIDFYLVNNSLCKAELSEVTSTPVHVVPHHTVNFDGDCNLFVEKKTYNVGYIGLDDQFDAKDELTSLALSGKINFVQCHPNTREDVVEMMKKIDIGVVYVEKSDRVEPVLKYKPNVKLSNFQSFGIPTIACEYSSFKEFGGDAWVKVKTKKEFSEKLVELIDPKNYETLRHLASRTEVIGNKFHIDCVISDYYKQIEESFA